MRLFKCNHCSQILYFENNHCENCGLALGFVAERLDLLALQQQKDGIYTIWGENDSITYQYCVNQQYNVCNWLIPVKDGKSFCKACSLNRTIPDISNIIYRQRWNTIENAKHRLVYALLRLNLPLVSKYTDAAKGLSFDFMADEINSTQRILTGHDNGVITINIAEADDIEREMTRRAMDEVYRTVLGHFRHEVGHYYWDRLINNTTHLEECRNLFGDDRKDYGEALNLHYSLGAPTNWNEQYISSYATMHPWEDWAETWAHYLHIIDTVETGFSFGISIHPILAGNSILHADLTFDPYKVNNFNQVLNVWFPLTFALNSLNRSMGLHDLYPFVVPPKAIEKLLFIHKICLDYRTAN